MKINNKIDLENYFPYLLRAISAHISSGTKTAIVRSYRIGMREWRVLALMADRGAATGKEICHDSGMDKASVSRALKYLGDYGLVRQNMNDTDWRSKPYSLSEEGVRVYEEIAESKISRSERLWEDLSENERQQLVTLLQKLKRNVYRVLDESER